MARTLNGCVLVLALAAGTAASGCSGATVDAREALRLAEVTTGWLPAESAAGNKVVPVLSFRLDNTGAAPLGVLQVNAIFRRSGEELDWGNVLVRAVRTGRARRRGVGRSVHTPIGAWLHRPAVD